MNVTVAHDRRFYAKLCILRVIVYAIILCILSSNQDCSDFNKNIGILNKPCENYTSGDYNLVTLHNRFYRDSVQVQLRLNDITFSD